MKKIVTIAMAVLLIAGAGYADKITWGSSGAGVNGGVIVDHEGNAISAGAPDFVISMWNVTQGTFTGMTTDFTTVGGGYFYANFDWGASPILTVSRLETRSGRVSMTTELGMMLGT